MFKAEKLRIAKKLSFLSFLIIGLSGCRDFSEVGNLGKRWEIIKTTSETISNNYYQSCKNRAKFPDKGYFPAVIDTRANEFEEKCQKVFLDSKQIVEVNSVLALYLQKLAILADENSAIAESDKIQLKSAANDLLASLSKLATSNEPQPQPNPTENILAKVFGNTEQLIEISGFLLNIVAEKTRENAIIPTIICTNDEIDEYTQRLELIADTVYINALDEEQTDLKLYYRRHQPKIPEKVTAPNDTPSPYILPNEALALVLLDRQFNDQMDDIEARKEVGKTFANFLEETRITHSKISQEFENSYGKSETKEQFCQNSEIISDTSFELNKIQAYKIAAILQNYQEKTAPLIEQLEEVNQKNTSN